MRHRPKYKLPRSRKGLPPSLYAVLVVLLLGAIGWVVWGTRVFPRGDPTKSGTHRPPVTAAAPVSRAPATAPRRETAIPPLVVSVPLSNPPPVVASLAPAPGLAVPPASSWSNAIPRAAELIRTGIVATVPGLPTNAPGTATVVRAMEPTPLAVPRTNEFPRPVQDWFEAQVALDRMGISCGSIDGLAGSQTRSALRAFQAKAGLRVSGELDAPTRAALVLGAAPCTGYRVGSEDVERLQPISATWVGKSQQTALEFETILELIAEKGHAHPKLIRNLNPTLRWADVDAGVVVCLPDAAAAPPSTKAAMVVISLSERTLEALDAGGHLLAHFPCSIAQRVDKRPVGDLHVVVLIRNPTYTFNPEIFPESAEARRLKNKLVLPPGPNNPVGVAWIGLDKSGYGIHGTPSPEQVGRTESHGCFRLANWNAKYLLSLAWAGMPVRVVK